MRTDATMGAFRWLTVGPKGQPDPGDRAHAHPAGAFATDDCRATYEQLKARGVEFRGPPEERPYGIEAVLKDDSGNWFALVQHH